MMSKFSKVILACILTVALVGCDSSETIVVNTKDGQKLSGNVFGLDAMVNIGGSIWYDSTTRIVYWWNGFYGGTNIDSTPSPYYAPNGFPYRYNPETNTFEEINHDGI